MSFFTCFIDDVVDTVNQVAQQANVVDDVQNMLRNGMQPIEGGGWTGDGARAFIDEVNGRLLPEIAQLMASIAGFGGGITSAIDIVSGFADEAFGVVNSVCDFFDSIF